MRDSAHVTVALGICLISWPDPTELLKCRIFTTTWSLFVSSGRGEGWKSLVVSCLNLPIWYCYGTPFLGSWFAANFYAPPPPSFALLAKTDPPQLYPSKKIKDGNKPIINFSKSNASVNQVQKSIPDLTINESCATRRWHWYTYTINIAKWWNYCNK